MILLPHQQHDSFARQMVTKLDRVLTSGSRGSSCKRLSPHRLLILLFVAKMNTKRIIEQTLEISPHNKN